MGRDGEAAAKMLPAWAGVGRAKRNPARNISRWHLPFALLAAVLLLFPAGREYYFLARVPRQGRCICAMQETRFAVKELHGYVLAGVLNALSKTAGRGNINLIKENQ